MDQYENEVELMDYLNVVWKRKWLIIIPTFLIAVAVGIVSFLTPPAWEVDAIIQPSKFFVQTEQGLFEEVVVVDPKQIAGQINQESYNRLIAAELNLDLREFPQLKAENPRDTKLVRVSIRTGDIEKGKAILNSLFNHLKGELNKKIDVEMKGINTKISEEENRIKSMEIEKNRINKDIATDQNKLRISEKRVENILEEMKAVKKRVDELDGEMRKALAEGKQGTDAISLLLYSNEVQQNLRYYDTLDEKLSAEKIIQENLHLGTWNKQEQLRQIDTQINQTINEIKLLEDKKARIDYAQLIKEPMSSLYPVSPRKKLNVAIAGILGLFMFTILAFFLEYLENQKVANRGKS